MSWPDGACAQRNVIGNRNMNDVLDKIADKELRASHSRGGDLRMRRSEASVNSTLQLHVHLTNQSILAQQNVIGNRILNTSKLDKIAERELRASDSRGGHVRMRMSKLLFGEDPQGDLLTTGLSFHDYEWNWFSRTFNIRSKEWQDDDPLASELEQ